MQAVFQSSEITLGESVKLTFDASAQAANGTHEVTVNVRTAGGQTSSARFTLTVTGGGDPEPGDFTLGASPNSVTVAAGKTISTTITSQGTGSGINLTASGVPSGVQAEFQPSTITGGGNAKLSFTAGSSVTTGTHTVTVTGRDSAGKTATTTVTLRVEGSGNPPVGDVRVTANPSSGTGSAGQLIQTSVTASGGTGSLRLSATGVPAGTQVFWNPQTVGQGGTSNVWFFTNFQTPVGTHTVTITATSADGKSGSTTFRMTVTRFGYSFGGNTSQAW